MIGAGKEKGGTSAGGEQSWRELAGPRKRRINSPQAKKRRQKKLLRLVVSGALVLALIGGIVWGVLVFQDRGEAIPLAPPSKPIERILFDSNGVLPNSWLSSVIKLRPGMSMMEADIFDLKAKLEAEGQVKSASVERVFPSALRIVVEERIPVLRLVTMGQDGKRVLRIVGRDGTVYRGVGYPKAMLQHLPFVQPYKNPDSGYFPMRGIERVAELLEYARQNTPELFATWQVVSLEHYSGDLELPGQVIEVRSSIVPRIIFGAAGDYGQQMDRLNYILSYVQNHGDPSIDRIDLSLRGSAAVQFSSGRIGTF